MFSAWGKAWDCAWSNSWGPCKTDAGGGGTATKKKRRKKGQGWANELEILRRSLEKPEPVEAKAPPKRVKIAAPVKSYTVERVGGLELIEEARQIQAEINAKMDAFKAGEIAREEMEAFVQSENEAIEIIMMALDLDKHVILSIIT